MNRRLERYRAGRAAPDLKGAVVVLVDDGVATGSTMRAAVMSVRREHPAWLVVAVPAGPRDTVESLRGDVDALVCLETPSPFYAVGQAYRSFPQVTDEEVERTLASAWGTDG
jgi:predicted phosphoribosyltransferase